MKQQTHKTFSTDSFQLASFLLAESCKLISLDRTNPRRVVFVFEESEEREKLTEAFLSHTAKIEPHKLYASQRDLKQMIYQNNNS